MRLHGLCSGEELCIHVGRSRLVGVDVRRDEERMTWRSDGGGGVCYWEGRCGDHVIWLDKRVDFV